MVASLAVVEGIAASPAVVEEVAASPAAGFVDKEGIAASFGVVTAFVVMRSVLHLF